MNPGEEATWTSREDNSHSVDRGQGKLTSGALGTYQNFQLRFTELGETTTNDFLRRRAGPSLCFPSLQILNELG